MQIMKNLKYRITGFRQKLMKKYWFSLDDKIRFLLVGGFNFCVSYLIFSLLCLIFGTSFYQIVLAATWALSSVVSFSTQKFLVFRGKDKWYKEYLKCCTTWIFSYLINAAVLEIFVKFICRNVYISQFAATLISAIFTYILFKKFAFKRRKNTI